VLWGEGIFKRTIYKIEELEKDMDITDLQLLEQESIQRGIPILGSAKGEWLLNFILEHKPRRVLELGTANGYSGCILGSAGAELTTIDINQVIVKEAEENFTLRGVKATIIVGNGVEIVGQMAKREKFLEYYDLIFIDFAKKQYLTVLEDCLRLVVRGGYIIADNITMGGCLDFKERVMQDARLVTELIEIKDGLSCSWKKNSGNFDKRKII